MEWVQRRQDNYDRREGTKKGKGFDIHAQLAMPWLRLWLYRPSCRRTETYAGRFGTSCTMDLPSIGSRQSARQGAKSRIRDVRPCTTLQWRCCGNDTAVAGQTDACFTLSAVDAVSVITDLYVTGSREWILSAPAERNLCHVVAYTPDVI